MKHTVSVRSASLVAAGRKLAGVSKEVEKALVALRSVLHGTDRPWGTDEVGTPFDEAFARLRTRADRALASYHGQIRHAAGSLPAAARLFDRADEESEANVKARLRALWPTPPAG